MAVGQAEQSRSAGTMASTSVSLWEWPEVRRHFFAETHYNQS